MSTKAMPVDPLKIVKMPVIVRAQTLAFDAHKGQVRKYTGEPYIVHPIEVAEIVAGVPHTDSMLAAALLHDVVEDTDVTLADLNSMFNKEVVDLVEQLTDVSKPEDGNRKVRKEKDRQHTAQASADAKTIKLADLISNTRSIVKHDPGFAKVYMSEKRALLDVLVEGDSSLWATAKRAVDRYFKP